MAGSFALGLGGNLGDVRSSMQGCVKLLRADNRVSELRVSSLYLTSPWGKVEGGEFLNCVVCGKWQGGDIELLHLCRSVESAYKSPVNKNGAARMLDVDVLFLDGGSSSEELILPHPRMTMRKFVLVPLCELWSEPVPGLGETPDVLLKRVHDSSSIILQGGLYSP